MITRVTAQSAQEAISFALCPQRTVKVQALLKAYGTDCPFFETYFHNGQSLLCRLESSLTIFAGPGADYEELASFARPFTDIFSDAETLRRLAAILGGARAIEAWNLLTLPPDAQVALAAREEETGGYEIKTDAELRSVAPLLWGPGGPPDETYADLSHRLRHGCARAFLLLEGGSPMACCLVSAQSEQAGLLGGVATLPAYRGRGYAGALVRTACRALIRAGRLPVLECEDALLPFYHRLGFAADGRSGRLTGS